MTDATSDYLNRAVRDEPAAVVDLEAARRVRGLRPARPVPTISRPRLHGAPPGPGGAQPPAGIAVGDRVYIRSCGVWGHVTGAEPLPGGHWHLAVLSGGVTYSCTDLTAEPAPDSARA